MLFKKALADKGIRHSIDVDTSKISAIRAGGVAKLVVFPKSADEFIYAVRQAKRLGVRYKIIGRATNIFFSDMGFDGALISTSDMLGWTYDGGGILADAGVSLPRLIRDAALLGMKISPELSGIPGSVGGAVRNNAGAYGREFSDLLECGEFYSADEDKVIVMTDKELDFSYRSSILVSTPLYFLRGKIKADFSEKERILSEIACFSKQRREKQPSEPSLGSFFKRGKNYYASRLIDECGLKGASVGGAVISEKHAGFIINKGGATASDVNALAEFAENSVYGRFGIRLQRETEFIE